MGASVSQPRPTGREMSLFEKKLVFEFPFAVDSIERMEFGGHSLCNYSILPVDDEDKLFVQRWLGVPKSLLRYKEKQSKPLQFSSSSEEEESDEESSDDPRESLEPSEIADFEELGRAVGAMLGMAVGDALGAPLEFLPYISPYDTYRVREKLSDEEKAKSKGKGKKRITHKWREVSKKERQQLKTTGFDPERWEMPGHNRFGLLPGQWTDDASMGLCLADSLLVSYPELQPLDLRLRFLNWWQYGYCNAFGLDPFGRGGRSSVGLGGNIGASLSEFRKKKTEYTTSGDRKTSGNGSIMRLAAVPVAFHDDVELAMQVAYKQSKTTHQGDEAAECCRLMTYIIIQAIKQGPEAKKHVLSTLHKNFESPLYSVSCLAASKQEKRHDENDELDLADRNWNWQTKKFRYSPARSSQQPGYVGSYCMDGMAMALHCIWTTTTLEDCLLKVVNVRGDADTVGSIAGQMAGAFYGTGAFPLSWIHAIMRWDDGGNIATKAVKLYRHHTCTLERLSPEELKKYASKVEKERAEREQEEAEWDRKRVAAQIQNLLQNKGDPKEWDSHDQMVFLEKHSLRPPKGKTPSQEKVGAVILEYLDGLLEDAERDVDSTTKATSKKKKRGGTKKKKSTGKKKEIARGN